MVNQKMQRHVLKAIRSASTFDMNRLRAATRDAAERGNSSPPDVLDIASDAQAAPTAAAKRSSTDKVQQRDAKVAAALARGQHVVWVLSEDLWDKEHFMVDPHLRYPACSCHKGKCLKPCVHQVAFLVALSPDLREAERAVLRVLCFRHPMWARLSINQVRIEQDIRPLFDTLMAQRAPGCGPMPLDPPARATTAAPPDGGSAATCGDAQPPVAGVGAAAVVRRASVDLASGDVQLSAAAAGSGEPRGAAEPPSAVAAVSGAGVNTLNAHEQAILRMAVAVFPQIHAAPPTLQAKMVQAVMRFHNDIAALHREALDSAPRDIGERAGSGSVPTAPRETSLKRKQSPPADDPAAMHCTSAPAEARVRHLQWLPQQAAALQLPRSGDGAPTMRGEHLACAGMARPAGHLASCSASDGVQRLWQQGSTMLAGSYGHKSLRTSGPCHLPTAAASVQSPQHGSLLRVEVPVPAKRDFLPEWYLRAQGLQQQQQQPFHPSWDQHALAQQPPVLLCQQQLLQPAPADDQELLRHAHLLHSHQLLSLLQQQGPVNQHPAPCAGLHSHPSERESPQEVLQVLKQHVLKYSRLNVA